MYPSRPRRGHGSLYTTPIAPHSTKQTLTIFGALLLQRPAATGVPSHGGRECGDKLRRDAYAALRPFVCLKERLFGADSSSLSNSYGTPRIRFRRAGGRSEGHTATTTSGLFLPDVRVRTHPL